jgi:hypothetical protein
MTNKKPNGHKMCQHLPLQDPPNFTQIFIPSGDPDQRAFLPFQQMTTKKTAAVSALIGAFKEFEDEVKARA